MRLATRTIPLCAAFCVALASVVLPFGVKAQEPGAAPAEGISMTGAAPDATANFAADAIRPSSFERDTGDLNASSPSIPADAAAMNDFTLDDQMLSHQRGGASGMVMVATTPRPTDGSSVTLWDEIAPPTPLPVPVDASRAAQSNVAAFTRK